MKLPEKYETVLQQLLTDLTNYSHVVDRDLVCRAYEFSYLAHQDQKRKSGAPYFEHPMKVAQILTSLKMDYLTIAASLLHDVVEDTPVTVEEIAAQFGSEVALLVDGVTKIGGLKFENTEERQAENFRKMLLSMVNDARVILIKFADRLHNMRTIDDLPEMKRNRIAMETIEVYAPLAHRLGIGKIRWELEDLSFKVLDPKQYDFFAASNQ